LADDGSVLATITDRRQIYVYFNISDSELLDLMKIRPDESQSGPMDWSQVRVFLRPDEREDQWIEGRLNYVDQEGVDQATGTFALRAVIDNRQDLLVPGMFVSVRLPVGRIRNALLIPYQAVSHSQAGSFVLRVTANGEVEKCPVELGERIGSWIVVSAGLTGEDTFILEGLQQAMPGSQVVSKPAELSVADSPELQAMLSFFGGNGNSAMDQPEPAGSGGDEPGDVELEPSGAQP
jgi:RND family efflux transporter MFP subunit